MLKRSTLKKLVTLGLLEVATLVFLLPTHLANAAGDGWFSIGSFSSSAVSSFLGFFLNEIFKIIFGLIGILATTLNYAINVRAGGGVPVVSATWHILRDFSNMLFVIILVYVAFATIFDQKNYSFQSMITRFIIVAIMINFSLAIGNIVIDACQVLTNIFLGSIGNVGDRIGQFLNPSLLLPSNVNPADIAASGLTSAVFAVVLGAIMLFSLLVATTFSLIRVPFIWGLLIVSPLAWMSYIMPNSNGWWGKWWGQFIGWNLFLPVYLFFMYIGLLFLSKRDEIMSTVIQVNSGAANPANTPLLFGLTNTLTFNLIFFYIFTAVIMIGGTGVAVSVTKMMGGTGFEKGLGWAKSWVKRAPVLGGGRSLDSYEYAYGKKMDQIKKSGFQTPFLNKIYGGEEALNRARTSAGNQWPFVNNKQFTENAKAVYDKTSNDYNTGKIDVARLRGMAEKTSATSSEGYAYRKLLIEKGGMNGDMFKNSLTQLRGNPYAVNDFVKAAKDKKFAGLKNLKDIALDPSFAHSSYTAGRRDILQFMATDGKMAGGLKIEDVNKAVAILGGKDSPETKKFIDELGKIRPDLLFEFKMDKDTGAIVDPDDKTKITTRDDFWKKTVRTESKNIIAMPKDVWNSDDFQKAMRDKFRDLGTTSNRKKFKGSLEKMLSDKGEVRKIVPDEKGKFEKLDVLDLIEGEIGDIDASSIPSSDTPSPAATPPPATGVSYKNTQELNQANVIDLRNKKDIEIK